MALLSPEKGADCTCRPLLLNRCHPRPQWEEDWDPEADGTGGNWIDRSTTEVGSFYSPHLVLPGYGAGPLKDTPSTGLVWVPCPCPPPPSSLVSFQTHLPCPWPALPAPILPTTHTLPKRKGFFAQDFCPFSLDVSGRWQMWDSHRGTEIFSTGGIVSWARWG